MRSKITITLKIAKRRAGDVEDFADGRVTYHLKNEQEAPFRAWLETAVLAPVRALPGDPDNDYAVSLDVTGDQDRPIHKRMTKETMLEVERIVIAGQEALRAGAMGS